MAGAGGLEHAQGDCVYRDKIELMFYGVGVAKRVE